jgi:hypothetical protein
MPQLLVRDVPLDVIEALKRRAAEHGRSAEAEHASSSKKPCAPSASGFGNAPQRFALKRAAVI